MMSPTDCLLVMGRRGCGKSYLAQRLQKLWPRRVIIDSLDEYRDGDIVSNFEDFTEKLIEYRKKQLKEFELIYQFDPENDLSADEFNEILRVLFHFSNIQIVIEEVQLYSTPTMLPKWLKHCLLIGRHRNLSLLFTSQRPGQINKTIISQCAHIFCGQIFEGNDLKYVSNFLNQSTEKLINLPDRKFLYFSKDGIREISNNI